MCIKANISSLCGCGFRIQCCLAPYCAYGDWTFESLYLD